MSDLKIAAYNEGWKGLKHLARHNNIMYSDLASSSLFCEGYDSLMSDEEHDICQLSSEQAHACHAKLQEVRSCITSSTSRLGSSIVS